MSNPIDGVVRKVDLLETRQTHTGQVQCLDQVVTQVQLLKRLFQDKREGGREKERERKKEGGREEGEESKADLD